MTSCNHAARPPASWQRMALIQPLYSIAMYDDLSVPSNTSSNWSRLDGEAGRGPARYSPRLPRAQSCHTVYAIATSLLRHGDLAREVASASNGLGRDRLRHLIVTQFDDVLEGTDRSVIPSQWSKWLDERHTLPNLLEASCMIGKRSCDRKAGRLPCSLAEMIWRCCLTQVVRRDRLKDAC